LQSRIASHDARSSEVFDVKAEKMLFVCTGNVDRSRTAQDLLSGKDAFEVRSAGTWEWAVRRISKEDIDWADRIFAMEAFHKEAMLRLSPGSGDKITVLDIPNMFQRGDPGLVELLKQRLSKHGIVV